jgi:tungstate transport system permease protein
MDLIIEGIVRSFELLISGNAEVWRITFLSLTLSGTAVLLSLCIGMPAGVALALNQFWGRRFVVSVLNTGMGAPPVVVGLLVSIFIWRRGLLGFLEIAYTPYAIIIAQFVISLPLVAGFTMATIQQLDPKLRLQIQALGASRAQMLWLLIKETRLPLLAAVMAGFGAVISEVGASMMVGGNIPGQTRVLTTATVMEVGKGDFGLAMALSIILMLLAFTVNLILTMIQQQSRLK